MVADFGAEGFAVCSDEKGAGFLHRHVTIDAFGRDLISELWKLAALAGLMAGQAFRCECGRVALGGVDIVTGGASQSGGLLEAAATAQ